MKPPANAADVGAWIIGLGCTWEVLALATGRVPTWSRMTRGVPAPRRALIVAGVCAWLVHHMGPWRTVSQ